MTTWFFQFHVLIYLKQSSGQQNVSLDCQSKAQCCFASVTTELDPIYPVWFANRAASQPFVIKALIKYPTEYGILYPFVSLLWIHCKVYTMQPDGHRLESNTNYCRMTMMMSISYNYCVWVRQCNFTHVISVGIICPTGPALKGIHCPDYINYINDERTLNSWQMY